MKKIMKTKWKMLTLAAMLSATTTATAGDPSQGGGYDEDAYFADGSDYAESLYDDSDRPAAVTEESVDNEVNEVFEEDYYGDTLEPVAYVGDAPSYHSPSVGSGSVMQPASHSMNHSSMACGGCGDSSCGGSCGTTYSNSCGKTACKPRQTVLGSAKAWMTAEALLWFPEVRSTVPLVSTNANGALPELDAAGATVAFGGQDAFGGELQAGFRFDGGFMLSDDFGIGGRFWMLPETDDSYGVAADALGTGTSVGIPYFDSDLDIAPENSILINFNDGLNDGDPGNRANFAGTVSAQVDFEMYGTEAYGRLRLLEGKGYRSDFIGGFSHFGIDEGLTLNASTTQLTNEGGLQNEVLTFNDRIEAENQFFGGQLGFLTTVGRGAWSLTALTKVHLGDMEQTFSYAGGRSRNTFNNENAGIFGASFENVPGAELSQNNFTFAPEANLKLTFKMRPHVRFSVGYSFIMWDDVLLLGDNLNRNFATTGLINDGIGGALGDIDRPQFLGLETDSFFVHGLDLGAVIEF